VVGRGRVLHKPPRLHFGDTIGVVSPAAAVSEEKLRRGCQTLEQLGFGVRRASMCWIDTGTLPGLTMPVRSTWTPCSVIQVFTQFSVRVPVTGLAGCCLYWIYQLYRGLPKFFSALVM